MLRGGYSPVANLPADRKPVHWPNQNRFPALEPLDLVEVFHPKWGRFPTIRDGEIDMNFLCGVRARFRVSKGKEVLPCRWHQSIGALGFRGGLVSRPPRSSGLRSRPLVPIPARDKRELESHDLGRFYAQKPRPGLPPSLFSFAVYVPRSSWTRFCKGDPHMCPLGAQSPKTFQKAELLNSRSKGL